MRRIILVITLALVMATMMAASAMPVFADSHNGGNGSDPILYCVRHQTGSERDGVPGFTLISVPLKAALVHISHGDVVLGPSLC